MASKKKGRKYEKEMYYRRPLTGEHAGWIVVAGSIGGTQVQDRIERGFEPMYKYRTIPHNEQNPWRTILEHEDGPAEFPLEQIMTLRWWKEPPIEGVHFPQLSGHKVKEYRCPQCDRAPFAALDGEGGIEPLARHLRIMHSWDTRQLSTYGEKMGINFDAIYTSTETVFETELGTKCQSCDEEIPGKLADHQCKVTA